MNRDARAMRRWWLFGFSCAALAPSLLAACTSIKDKSASQTTRIDFGDLWTADAFPCGDDKLSVLLSIKQNQKKLIATSADSSECVPRGSVVWEGELPTANVLPSLLPLTFDVEVRLSEDEPIAGSVTIASADRLALLVDDLTIGMTRGASGPHADAGELNAGAGEAEGSSQRSAADGGSGGRGARAGAGGAGRAGSGGRAGSPNHAGDGGVDEGSTGGAAGSDGPAAIGGKGGAGASGGAGKGGSSPVGVAGAGPEAGSGDVPDDQPASGAAGSGATEWICMNVLDSCGCVVGPGGSGGCAVNYPCCFTLTMVGLTACQCWPDDSDSCRDLHAGNPEKKAAASCPP